jgi:myosin heavy subunit
MLLSYPTYTGREVETIVNLGDAAVPEGTRVRWLFQTQDADSLYFEVDNGKWKVENSVDKNGSTEVSRVVMDNMDYVFCVSSKYNVSDTLKYSLSAIKDAVPMIVVDEVVDSIYPDRHIFRGRIKDDYGFSKLVFVHKTVNVSDTTKKSVNEAEIAIDKANTSQEFYFTFNTAEIVLTPGDNLTYYFEVSDNDGIHGPKKARSQVFEVKIPTAEELDQILEQSSTEVRQSADAQMSELQKLQEEINEMMRRLVDKKELNWQDKKDLEEIAKKQKQVKDMMQQMQRQIQDNNRMEQRYREQSEQLMEKQRELDRLMNEVMDEKMKETMAEIDKLMQELDKNKVQQQLEQLKLDNSDLERQLDQNIELMKRLEIEKKVEQTIDKMDKLAEEQRNVSRETEQAKSKDKEQLMQKEATTISVEQLLIQEKV